MTADYAKLAGVLVGLLVVVFAMVLAYRQKTATWQHAFIFALGGVLAGISSVTFSIDADGHITATIGQVQQATHEAANATLQQEEAIRALSGRVDNLQQAIAAQQVAINSQSATLARTASATTASPAAGGTTGGAAGGANGGAGGGASGPSVTSTQAATVNAALLRSTVANRALLGSLDLSHNFSLRAQSLAVGKPPPVALFVPMKPAPQQ